MREEMRLSNLIYTFGPGSIINLREITVIGLGVEHWMELNDKHFYDALIKDEPRIIKELAKKFPKIEGLIQLEAFKDVNFASEDRYQKRIYPVNTFPQWGFCPRCRRLDRIRKLMFSPREIFDTPYVCKYCEKEGTDDNHRIIPSRFIMICKNAHLDDFPWFDYVHHNGRCKSTINLELRTGGKGSSLSNMMVICKNCDKTRDMGGIFSITNSFFVSRECTGRHPHLFRKEFERSGYSCDENMIVSLTGATSVYYPSIMSVLSIPTERMVNQEGWLDDLKFVKKTLEIDKISQDDIDKIRSLWDILPNIKNQYPGDKKILNNASDINDIGIRGNELLMFRKNENVKTSLFHMEIYSIPKNSVAKKIFSKIRFIRQVREVVALMGFYRKSYPGNVMSQLTGGDMHKQEMGHMSRWGYNTQYLPGMENWGEGVFFEINPKLLSKWKKGIFSERANILSEMSNSNISDEAILTHTLSHALIRVFAEYSGYSVSSLKERLYVNISVNKEELTPGFLIYTATSDSEGTLGGLIKIFSTLEIDDLIYRMREMMSWCSSDPICITNKCNRQDILNHSACHACLLLPETSCELKNQILDRTFLVGPVEKRDFGFINL